MMRPGRIVREDLNEEIAAFVQDRRAIERGPWLENLIHRIFDPRTTQYRDQGSLRESGNAARVVPRARVRH